MTGSEAAASRGGPAGPLVLLLALLVLPAAAGAQEDGPWPGRLSLELGAGVAGGHTVGAATATLTSNLVPQGARFTLFAADLRVDSAAALAVRAGWQLAPAWSVEAELAYSDHPVRVRIAQDAVGAAEREFVGGRLAQYAIGGNVLLHPARLRLGNGRAQPYALAGGSYLRQLHDDWTFLEQGHLYRAGGGLAYLLRARPRHRLKALALRLDARWQLRTAGFELEGRRRSSAAVGAGLQVRF